MQGGLTPSMTFYQPIARYLYGKGALFLTFSSFWFPRRDFLGVEFFSVLYPQIPIPPSPPRLAKCHCSGKFSNPNHPEFWEPFRTFGIIGKFSEPFRDFGIFLHMAGHNYAFAHQFLTAENFPGRDRPLQTIAYKFSTYDPRLGMASY